MRNKNGASLRLAAGGAWLFVAILRAGNLNAEMQPVKGPLDSRVRVAGYSRDEVYRLHGYVGYQIDLEFEPGELFVGLGAGDIEGLSFVGQDNHLFLKPKAPQVATNLTVLTTRREYQFDYTAAAQHPNAADTDVIYVLRFTYPPPPAAAAGRLDAEFGNAAAKLSRNVDYWYCGDPALKPVAASDDGVHTRMRFGANAELPAIFVRNEDGSDSLLNYSMDAGDVIVHRVAHRFIVRRGKLTGCIVNQGFAGGGARLESGTIAPDVKRSTKAVPP
jgi:type IV secretion system protein VirB9